MQRLGQYTLLESLGSGGSAQVYRAVDLSGREVALKIIHPALAADTAWRQRLLREAEAMQTLSVPGAARLYECAFTAQGAYIAMELVPGPTLAHDVQTRGVWPLLDLADLAESLYTTLQQLHFRQLVHRDLKPENVILSPQGPVLIDFGLTQNGACSRLTSDGLVMGTPSYVSPELIAGGTPQPSDDEWALACTLLYCATGRAPFGEESIATVLARAGSGNCDTQGLDSALAALFRQALNPRLEARLSMTGLVRALRKSASEGSAAAWKELEAHFTDEGTEQSSPVAPPCPQPSTTLLPAPYPASARASEKEPDSSESFPPALAPTQILYPGQSAEPALLPTHAGEKNSVQATVPLAPSFAPEESSSPQTTTWPSSTSDAAEQGEAGPEESESFFPRPSAHYLPSPFPWWRNFAWFSALCSLSVCMPLFSSSLASFRALWALLPATLMLLIGLAGLGRYRLWKARAATELVNPSYADVRSVSLLWPLLRHLFCCALYSLGTLGAPELLAHVPLPEFSHVPTELLGYVESLMLLGTQIFSLALFGLLVSLCSPLYRCAFTRLGRYLSAFLLLLAAFILPIVASGMVA